MSEGMRRLQNVLKKIMKVMPVLNLETGKSYIDFQVPLLIGKTEDGQTLLEGDEFKGVPPIFQGKIMLLSVQLTENYPQQVPSLCLGHQLVYHPFIAKDNGSVCSTARTTEWNSKSENCDENLIRLIEEGVPSLLGTFEGDNPHNTYAYKEAKTDFNQYLKRAEHEYIIASEKQKLNPEKLRDLILQHYKENPEYPEPFVQKARNLGFQLLPLVQDKPPTPPPKQQHGVRSKNPFDDSDDSDN